MHALKRVSAVLFYLLGALTILGIVLVNRGFDAAWLSTSLNVIDLPLLLSGMLYAGSSFVLSFSHEKVSPVLATIVFVFLAVLFGFFAYMNFGYPFQVTL